MQAILTGGGKVVGWFRDPHVVCPLGQDIGFVRAWGLFSYDGTLRGYFEDGLFRDKSGLIVARIGKGSEPEPSIDWTSPRIKETTEHPLIIPFPSGSSVDGWKDVFAVVEPSPKESVEAID